MRLRKKGAPLQMEETPAWTASPGDDLGLKRYAAREPPAMNSRTSAGRWSTCM